MYYAVHHNQSCFAVTAFNLPVPSVMYLMLLIHTKIPLQTPCQQKQHHQQTRVRLRSLFLLYNISRLDVVILALRFLT